MDGSGVQAAEKTPAYFILQWLI